MTRGWFLSRPLAAFVGFTRSSSARSASESPPVSSESSFSLAPNQVFTSASLLRQCSSLVHRPHPGFPFISSIAFLSSHLPSSRAAGGPTNELTGACNGRSLLKLRALDVGFNVLESVEAGELPTSLRFLVTEGNPLGAMTLNSWKSFFHFQPLLLSHNTMPIENFLQRMTEADAAGKRPAVHAASADTGDDAHQPANRPLENTPRCHSRPVRFLPRTHTPRLVRPQPQAAHSHAAPTDALALTCHTHPLKGASLARQYFRAHPDISGAVGPSAPRRASLHEKTLQDAERGEAEQEGEWVHAFARSPAPGDSLDWREVWGDSRDSQGAREGGEGDVANAEVGGGVGGEEAGGHVAAAAEDLERRDGAPREPCAPEEACGAAETARESGKGMGEGEAGGQQQGTQPEPEEPAQQPRAPDDARDAPMACETELRSAAKRPKTSADVVAGEGTRETVRVSHVDDPDLGLIQVTERQAVLVALPDDSKAVYGGLDKWRRDEAEFRRRANESSGNFIDPVTQLRINRRSAASRAEAVTMQGLRQSQAAALEHVAVSLASVRACLATPRPLTAPGQRRVVPQHTSHAHKSALSTVADGMGDADEQDAAESLEIQELIHELMHGELQVPSRKPSPRDGEKTRAPQGAGLLPGDEGPASSTGGYVQRVSSRGTQWVPHNLNFPPEEYVFRPLSGTKGPASAVAHASKLSVRKVEALGSPQVVRARPGRQEGAAGTRWLASPMSLSTESISPLASPMSFRSKWLFQRLQPRHSDALDQGDKVLEHLPDGSEASPPAW